MNHWPTSNKAWNSIPTALAPGPAWRGITSKCASQWDILINATPVGGGSLAEQTLVPQALLKQGATVLDMIYDPLETRLLREAAQAGCAVISGFEMLLASAAAQFEVWTGAEAPVDAMRSSALLLAQTRST